MLKSHGAHDYVSTIALPGRLLVVRTKIDGLVHTRFGRLNKKVLRDVSVHDAN